MALKGWEGGWKAHFNKNQNPKRSFDFVYPHPSNLGNALSDKPLFPAV